MLALLQFDARRFTPMADKANTFKKVKTLRQEAQDVATEAEDAIGKLSELGSRESTAQRFQQGWNGYVDILTDTSDSTMAAYKSLWKLYAREARRDKEQMREINDKLPDQPPEASAAWRAL